jgi:hypothetical protein
MPEIGDYVMMARWGRSAVCMGTIVRATPATKFKMAPDTYISWASGDPNGVVVAGPGSMHIRLDDTNDAGDYLYVKADGFGNTGWLPMRFFSRRRTVREVITYVGASLITSFVTKGFQNGPTIVANAHSNADASTGAFLQHATTSVSSNVASVVAGTNSAVRPDWSPFVSFGMRVPTTITSGRWWYGMFPNALSPSGSDLPTSNCAGFRFSTNAGDVNYMTYTNDGVSTGTLTDTGIDFQSGVANDLAIWFANNGEEVVFLIDGREVARHTTNLPVVTTELEYGIYVTTLTAGARAIRWGRITIESEP